MDQGRHEDRRGLGRDPHRLEDPRSVGHGCVDAGDLDEEAEADQAGLPTFNLGEIKCRIFIYSK